MAIENLTYESDTISERSAGPDQQTWVEQTLQSIEKDARAQPWKKTFNNRIVDSGFDNGKDLITIKKSVRPDDDDDDDSVQGNSLAA